MYRHIAPEDMPPPALLDLAVPLTAEDVRSGVVGHLLETLSSFPGLRDLSPDRLQQCLAAGMGYGSWDDMVALRGRVANTTQMPSNEYELAMIIGWRMFVGGFSNLSNAVVAAKAALLASQLAVRRVYGLFGHKSMQDDEPPLFRRHVEIPGLNVSNWSPEPVLLPSGRLRMPGRISVAVDTASYCWSEASGVDPQTLANSIEDGSDLEIADAIDESWFAECWPVGLYPTQYLDSAGKVFGYGWTWPEIGCLHASVFASPSVFKQSAICLWMGTSTDHLACTNLPATLTMVEFDNPWDIRDHDTSLDPRIAHGMKVEGADAEGPWLDIAPTKNGKMDYGVTLEIGGQLWTRHHRELSKDLDATLGLVLPSMEDVEAKEQLIDWLQEKVPFAMEQATYENVCRLLCAVSELEATERDTIDDPSESQRMSDMLLQSALVAQPVIAWVSERQMTGNMGTVASWDVPQAGEDLQRIYPELDAIKVRIKGEYALAFYGKNGIRHDRAHQTRDLLFMRYCILRNLGLDPCNGKWDRDWLGAFRLVKRYVDNNPDVWVNAEKWGVLTTQAEVLLSDIATANQWLEELGNSSAKSRLHKLGLTV